VDEYRDLMHVDGRDAYRYKMLAMIIPKVLMLPLMWWMIEEMYFICDNYPGLAFALWAPAILGMLNEGLASMTHYVRQRDEARLRGYERTAK
jgi:hypothetical protein